MITGNVGVSRRLPSVANILVVEDEPMVLDLAESVLLHAGHDTVTASSMAEAEAIILSDQVLDAIFTDISLYDEPEGGLKVGKLSHGIPVLYTSGNRSPRPCESISRNEAGFFQSHTGIARWLTP